MAKKTKAVINESLAKEIDNKFAHALSWREPFKQKWDRYYKMYRSHLEETNYPWQSNIWVPYAFSTIETLAPRMIANRPQIDVMPRESGDEEYADIQSELIDFQWEQMGADDLLQDIVKSALIYGTSIIKVSWRTEKEEVVSKQNIDDTNPDLGIIEQEEEKTTYDGPSVELVDLYDFFWDPKAVDMESSRWVIHRMHRTYDHIEDLAEKGIYKNVKLLKGMKLPGEDDQKSVRRSTLGISLPDDIEDQESGMQLVELLEYWEDDRVITIANRKIVIRDEKNPYRHGKKPFIRLIDQSVPHEFVGIGELEPIETLQYELNDRRNQRMDNVTLILNRMWKVQNGSGVDENELVSDAGGVVHVDDMNGLEPIVVQDVTASSYQEETLIKGDIQQTTGVSDFTRGVGSDALANDTATGISLIQEAGNSRFRLKIRNLESAIEKIGEMIISMNEQFIQDDVVIRLLGDQGYQWKQIKPDDLRSNFDVAVQSGSTLPSNEAVEKKQIMDMYQLFAGDPQIDQQELKRRVLESFGVKNIDNLLVQQQAIPQVEAPQVDTGGQLDQQGILQSAMGNAGNIGL